MRVEATYSVEENQYIQIKVNLTEDRLCLTFKIGNHLWGQAFNSPDSTIEFSMPQDFGEELAGLLRTLAGQLEAKEGVPK